MHEVPSEMLQSPPERELRAQLPQLRICFRYKFSERCDSQKYLCVDHFYHLIPCASMWLYFKLSNCPQTMFKECKYGIIRLCFTLMRMLEVSERMLSLSVLVYLDLTTLQNLTQNFTDEQYSSLSFSQSSGLCHTKCFIIFNENSYSMLFLKERCFKYLESETAFCKMSRKWKSWKQIESFPARKSYA